MKTYIYSSLFLLLTASPAMGFKLGSDSDTQGELSAKQMEIDFTQCQTDYDSLFVENGKESDVIPRDFFDGSCLWFAEQSKSFGKQEAKLLEVLVKSQGAQDRGLRRPAREFAKLMEGWSYCQLAGVYKDQVNTTSGKDKFCSYRVASRDILDPSSWTAVDFIFKSSDSFDAFDLIDDISACYNKVNGPLGGSFDSVCPEQQGIDRTTLQSLSSEAANDRLDFYLGSEGELAQSPLAMVMERKRFQAEAAANVLTNKAEALNEKNLMANESLDQLKALYESVNPNILEAVQAYRNSYRWSVGTVTLFQDWENGLMIENGRDYGFEIDGGNSNPNALKYKIDRLLDLENREAELADLAARLESVATMQDVIDQKTKRLCQIYFCEVARSRPIFTQDQQEPFLAACQHPDNINNPLCNEDADSIYLGDHRTKPESERQGLRALCKNVWPAAEQYGVVQQLLNRTNQKSCFN